MQIDAFMQMPKEKRPPKKMWDNQRAIDEWIERVYSKDKDTELEFYIDDVEG